MKTKTQNGFTLIELIVVISILGILAAFAIPKFIAIETDARASVIQAVGGSVRSASVLAHALSIANGNGSASNTSVTMEGAEVTMANGYPTADFYGIGTAVTISGDVTQTGGVFTAGATTAATCQVTYIAATPTVPTVPPVPPVILVNTDNCI